MKILQIIQRSQHRGAETFACQLSEELQKMGHKVDMLILFGEPSGIFNDPLHFFYLKANEQKRWRDFAAYKQLNSFIQKGGYDIVQANAGDTLKYASLSKKIYRWKPKLILRNANKTGDFLNSSIKKLINKWLVREVDFVASVSEECKIDFEKAFNFPAHRTANLPIGVNIEIQSAYQSLAEVGIKGSGPFILNVASFVPEKNHIGLIRIFSQVVKDVPNAKLLLVGEGKLKTETEVFVRESKLNNSVLFLGSRNDVLQLMACCHVFLLPSLIEGLPAVILEAFISKLPVIANDVGGIKEVLIDKQTGWLINKNDETGFINALKESLTISTETITTNAYEMAITQYSNQQIAKRFLAFYEKALNNIAGSAKE